MFMGPENTCGGPVFSEGKELYGIMFLWLLFVVPMAFMCMACCCIYMVCGCLACMAGGQSDAEDQKRWDEIVKNNP